MSEAEWQRCIDPDLMQEYLRRTNTVSDRKFRLFGCACCRRVAHRLTDERNRRVIELEERYADGLVSRAKLRAAWIAAGAGVVDARAALEDAGAALGISRFLVARRPVGELGGAWLAALATAQNGGHPAWRAALGATNCAAMASAWGAAGSATGTAAWTAVGDAEEDGPWTAPWNAARKAGRLVEEKAQAALLRHIIGNPFHSHSRRVHFPSTVIQLAEALYDGEDCAFALHDALLEAGQIELAEHFAEKDHPKGCWAMDLLLGKS